MPISDGAEPENAGDLILKPLPSLAAVKSSEKTKALIEKIHLCKTICNFKDEDADNEAKNVKWQTLKEIIEFVENYNGELSEKIYSVTAEMFSANVFRSLPVNPYELPYVGDDDDATPQADWSHLELVYRFFLRLLEAKDFHPNKARKFLTNRFIIQLLDRFSSEDDNEREQLKVILHRVYAKFLSMRGFIRKKMIEKMLEFRFCALYFPGLIEVLEVMGSIIHGFVLPYKPDHINFLFQVLLPLHTSHKLPDFHAQLVYCVIQFVEKDKTVAGDFVLKFLKIWPRKSTVHEILFLGELEEIIDAMQPGVFYSHQHAIITRLAKCIQSESYQVAERAMFFWQNEYVVSLLDYSAPECLRLLMPSLLHSSSGHWSKNVSAIARQVLHTFVRPKEDLFRSAAAQIKLDRAEEKRMREKIRDKWLVVERMARSNLEMRVVEESEKQKAEVAAVKGDVRRASVPNPKLLNSQMAKSTAKHPASAAPPGGAFTVLRKNSLPTPRKFTKTSSTAAKITSIAEAKSSAKEPKKISVTPSTNLVKEVAPTNRQTKALLNNGRTLSAAGLLPGLEKVTEKSKS